ncbi:MAG: hypothetical protein NXY59_00385 [Aigarchaeota archaeon]|nr:hypothetical protein [Candidatus Pelearchaeum maunauluense]
MSIPVSVKLRREVVELADRMVELGLARSRSHAVNLMIQHGLEHVAREVEFWERVRRGVEELRKAGHRISHGGLRPLLDEERGSR